MGFTEAVKTGFSKYVDFTGRALRSEYWYWVLFVVIASFVCGILDAIVFGTDISDPEVLGTVFSLATLLPSLAVTARRLHDKDRSGWWQLAPYGMVFLTGAMIVIGAYILAWAAGTVAVVLTIVLLVWMVTEGSPGRNRFGPHPQDPPDVPGEFDDGFHRSSIPPSGRE